MKKEEFNGYNFSDIKIAKKIKYVVIYDGDLDLNGVYGFKSRKDMRSYLKELHKDVTVFETKFVAKVKANY